MSKQKQPDAFGVTDELLAQLRAHTGDPTSINGTTFRDVWKTVFVVRAINRLTDAVKENTRAITTTCSPRPGA
ncbi:MAG: hypothetical protein ACRECV_02055 [Xanthobacteraceae bacterium]